MIATWRRPITIVSVVHRTQGNHDMAENNGTSRSDGGTPATRTAIPVFLLLSLVFGLADRFVPEIFPFASWSMFSNVPSEMRLYTLVLHGSADESLDPPVTMNMARHLLRRQPDAISVKMLWNWGRAVEGGRANDAAAQRRLVEARLLPPGTAYDLVVQTSDVLERWRTGTVETNVLLSGLVAVGPES